MTETMIARHERDLLRDWVVLYEGTFCDLALMIEGRVDPEPDEATRHEAAIALEVLDLIGWDLEGDEDFYSLPHTPAVREFLEDLRETEWITVDDGEECADPEHSADQLATAERILLDFEPDGSPL